MQTAVRCYVYNKQKKNLFEPELPNLKRVLVFDTETTTDMYQNLTFGSFIVYQDSISEHRGIFYNPNILSKKEIKIIKKFCRKYDIQLYTRKEFVEKVFYPEIYGLETLCIGFNLPFDLSRLAIHYGYARRTMKKGFSFKLSENKKFPRLRIKHINSKMSFINFASGLSYYGNKSYFRGNFLDLKTLAFALTNKDHSLKSACKLFDTEHKKTEAEHGKITEKYLEYNLNDVRATYDLFLKLKEEYRKYNLPLSITRVYSPASIGKACLHKFGIKSFLDKNPNFPKKLLGYIMTTYYGGRCEVKIRKTPVKVTLIDFLSMYPTVCILQNLWKFIISDNIKYIDDTKNVIKFIENMTLGKLRKKSTWKQLNAIAEIEADEDILPVRANYNKNIFNIGINYVSSERRLWYTLADVIASKLLTGKTPKIKRAIRFIPVGIQKDLKSVNILGIDIGPLKEDFFKILIEKRRELQIQMRIIGKEHPDYKQLESKQHILKIIANSCSYGIFVEINTDKINVNKFVDVYGLDHFKFETDKVEKFGQAFNPIIAVLITSASRLILAITEVLLRKHDETYAFCDTDSMAVPSKCVNDIQDFFKILNPYSFKIPLFKIDKNKDKTSLKNIWFYGISSKRYVLYKKDKKITILKPSLHGLGHLSNPFNSKKKKWHDQVWLDMLKEHYGIISDLDFNNKYSGLYAIVKLTASTPEILKRFRRLNKNKNYEKQIKPFNFILVGIGNRSNNTQIIKPITPFSKSSQEVVYNKFIDYNSGNIFNGIEYWKPLNDVLFEYKNHPESKSEGNIGLLKRKHVNVTDIIHIGKESDNLENVGCLDDPSYSEYKDKKELAKKLLNMTSKEASKYGIRRNTLKYIKDRIKSGKTLRLYKKTSNRLKDIL